MNVYKAHFKKCSSYMKKEALYAFVIGSLLLQYNGISQAMVLFSTTEVSSILYSTLKYL